MSYGLIWEESFGAFLFVTVALFGGTAFQELAAPLAAARGGLGPAGEVELDTGKLSRFSDADLDRSGGGRSRLGGRGPEQGRRGHGDARR